MLYAVLGDIHAPFHDMRKIDLFLYVCQELKVTHVILNGDIIDFAAISAHGPKDPDLQISLEDEIYETRKLIDYMIDKLHGVKFIYGFGNHEFRLDRFTMKNCPSFWNIVKLQNMFNLKEKGIDFYHYNERYQIEKTNCFVQHSPPSYSENAALTSLKKKFDQDHIYGCTHRPDWAIRPGSSGKLYQTHCLGWFGSTGYYDQIKNLYNNNRAAFKWTKNHEQWSCSFALVSTDGKKHDIQHIIIKNYQCAVGDHVFYA